MARFRKSDKQAQHIVDGASALGKARQKSQQKTVHSIGSKRTYQASLKLTSEWLVKNGNLNGLDKMSSELCITYLSERAEYVTQKTLDQDRQALQFLPNIKENLPVVKSEIGHGKLGQQSRAYTPEQLSLIRSVQSPAHALATELAEICGLRAHEMYTLKLISEQSASLHRVWSENRFSGLDGIRYSVVGKGGLVREICLPHALSAKLELNRRSEPLQIQDRKVFYQSHYIIAGGQRWSQSFSESSSRLFGWSHGGHGCRHSFAQNRMNQLQEQGFLYKSALEIVSQEMGHFRPQITEIYLR